MLIVFHGLELPYSWMILQRDIILLIYIPKHHDEAIIFALIKERPLAKLLNHSSNGDLLVNVAARCWTNPSLEICFFDEGSRWKKPTPI